MKSAHVIHTYVSVLIVIIRMNPTTLDSVRIPETQNATLRKITSLKSVQSIDHGFRSALL